MWDTDPALGPAPLAGTPHTVITEDAIKAVLTSELGITQLSEQNKRAIRAIGLANMMVDSNQVRAQLHVDGETFHAAHNRLHILREATLAAIGSENYETARSKLGEALHTVQDFYSHSNWVELNHNTGHPRFGAVGPKMMDLPQELARPTDATCTSCEKEIASDDACKDNLVTGRLTSGYYEGSKGMELDAPKLRNSKCSHGGITDRSAPDDGAAYYAEGINKDTISRTLSPHYHLHEQAVAAALDATKNYLKTIRAGTDEAHFRALFTTTGSLALVVDVSRSMEDVLPILIDQARTGIGERIRSQGYANKLVLIGFADPDLNPKYAGMNLDWFNKTLNELAVREGGDCPEVSLDATLEALWSSEPGGILFLITDADAKNKDLAGRVNEVARQRRVKIHPLLLSPTNNPCGEYSADVYGDIASGTGGSVHRLSRAEIGGIAKPLANLSQPNGHLNLTLGAASAKSGAQNKSGGQYLIPLDSTVSKAAIIVSGVTNAELVRPSGALVTAGEANIVKTALTDEVLFELTSPEPGTWSVSVAGQPRGIHVTSNSALEIVALDFVELRGRPDHQGYFPSAGLPTVGTAQAVAVELSQPIVEGKLELRSTSGDVLTAGPLLPRPGKDGKGNNDGHYGVRVTPPSVPFVAYVTGKTLQGERFERSQMSLTEPQYLAISAPVQQAVHPGDQVEYVFQLQNRGAADRFAVRVSDQGGFVVSAREQMLPVGAGESSRVIVTAKALPKARIGAESTIHVDVVSVSNPRLSTYGSVDLEVTENLDLDDDNLLNDQDNCISKSNPDQLDYDGDGTGNACDTTPGEAPPELGCKTAPARHDSPLGWWAGGAALALAALLRGRKKRANARYRSS